MSSYCSSSRKRQRNDTKKASSNSKDESSSSCPTTTTKNAFAVLLASQQQQQQQQQQKQPSKKMRSQKKRKPSTIRFIPCPAGCGQHISAHNVNRHLDQCIIVESETTQKRSRNQQDKRAQDDNDSHKEHDIVTQTQPYATITATGASLDESMIQNNEATQDETYPITTHHLPNSLNTQQSTPPSGSLLTALSPKSSPATTFLTAQSPKSSPATTATTTVATTTAITATSPHLLEKTQTIISPAQTVSRNTALREENGQPASPEAIGTGQEKNSSVTPPSTTIQLVWSTPPSVNTPATVESSKAGDMTPNDNSSRPNVSPAVEQPTRKDSLAAHNEEPLSTREMSSEKVSCATPRQLDQPTEETLTTHSDLVSTQDMPLDKDTSVSPRKLESSPSQSKIQETNTVERSPNSTDSTEKGKETTSETASSSPPPPSQLFAHMMARSREVFSSKSQKQATTTDCWFWYTPQGVSMHSTALHATVPIWTATVALRDGPTVHLATSIPSLTDDSKRRRWVQHHSRLSVPVLKFILQKSIRRRKPLPSVRVAMELADKSMGDFLRRLPVIVLEDSTLHPDMGIIVWLMMALSKEYVPSPFSMERAFRVVFEIASCRWQDHLDLGQTEEEFSSMRFSTIMDAFERNNHTEKSESRHSLLACIWSTLARASYGGMQGDVRMLHSFAALWYQRVKESVISPNCPVAPTSIGPDKCVWTEVPALLHQRSREQSTAAAGLFMDLIKTGVDYLRLTDISVEGVDFHCSAVIDHLLRDEELVDLSGDLLVLSNEKDFPDESGERREFLAKIWKSCMWFCCSGVNYRRPLITRPGDNKSCPKKYENLWKSLAEAKANEFQCRYIQDRLFKSPY